MKTIREETFGKSVVRLLKTNTGYAGVVINGTKMGQPRHGDEPDQLWKELVSDLLRASPNYFGYDGAIIRFRKLFPEGMGGAQFRENERGYKEDARDQLLETVPLEAAHMATEEHCGLIAKVYAKTNMLSQFEHARVRDVLKSRHGTAFIRGAAALAAGRTSEGLRTISEAMKDYGQLSWPAATYLPFLWDTQNHMFLKPQVTKDFAERVGHRFANDYSAQLEPAVYDSLLDLARETTTEIAPLAPEDRIDIQSFIWVVGAYTDSDSERQRAQLDQAPA